MNIKWFSKGVGRKNTVFGIVLILFWSLFFAFNIGEDMLSNFFTLPENTRVVTSAVHGFGIFLGGVNYFVGFLINKLESGKNWKQVISYSFILAGLFRGVFKIFEIFPQPYLKLASLGFLGDVFFTLGLVIFIYFNK